MQDGGLKMAQTRLGWGMGMGNTTGFVTWVWQVWVWCQISQPVATLHPSRVTHEFQPQCGNHIFPSHVCLVLSLTPIYALVPSLKQVVFTPIPSHLCIAPPSHLTLALTLAPALTTPFMPSHLCMAPRSPGPSFVIPSHCLTHML